MEEKYIVKEYEHPVRYYPNTRNINDAERFTRKRYLELRKGLSGWFFCKIEEDGKLTKVSHGVCGQDQTFDWLPDFN
jgi:hypothetical protein